MDLTKEAIEKIESLVSNTVQIGDATYSFKPLNRVFNDVFPSTLTVSTLAGFCDFINRGVDELPKGGFMVHIEDYKTVSLISGIEGERKERAKLLQARLSEDLKRFEAGRWMPQEAFLIELHSIFERGNQDDLEYVSSYISHIVSGTNFNTEDDGISQTVAVTRGASGVLKSKEALKPIVKLAPYRTFRDVRQPESEFLLRVRLDAKEETQVALFEADGGIWTYKAVDGIKAFIAGRVPDIPIIL